MKDGRPWPGDTLHHHQAQRLAGHVHSVAQCIRTKQRRARIVAEDVDKRPWIDRIDMLRQERKARAREMVRNPRMHRLEPLYGREQPERSAAGSLDQPRIGAG